MDSRQIAAGESYHRLYAGLSPERRRRTDRNKNEEDRHHSVAAAYLLRCGFERLNIPCDTVKLCENEHGKPYLENYSGVEFSISHSGGLVICAFAAENIGCDVQRITQVKPDISRRFCESEFRHIQACSSEQAKRELLFRYWTLKESFVKAVGTGFSLPFDSFSLDLSGESVEIRQSFDSRQYYFKEPELMEGYKCAVCSAAEDICDLVPEWVYPERH